MHILMRMPSKNVYVSESDLPLFDRAARLAGGMSAAVALGLRLYLAQHDEQEERNAMETIELKVDEGQIVTTKRFSGRRLLQWRQPSDDGTRALTARVYRTARGQYAVYLRDAPDWAVLSSPDDDNPIWENPRTWSGDWWSSKRDLRVFAAVEDMEGELPDDLVKTVRSVKDRPAVEDLDI